MTRRLRRHIARRSILPQVSFSGLAEEVGLSERSIRGVFEKHLAHLESIRGIETPRIMGMDGVYIKRQEALIVTDIERRRVVMIRPSIKERAVAAALREMPDRDKVEEVVADMAGGLDRAQKEVVPKARRTKDRYHVQRLVNAAVDKVRRALTPGKSGRKNGQMGMCSSHILRKRKKRLKPPELADLNWCLGLYPALRATYDLKEAYCEVWNSPDEPAARLKYAEWLGLHKAWQEGLPEKMREDFGDAFDPLIRLMKNWDEGIFNYFHARRTNAYTESANRGVKRLTDKAPRAKLITVSGKIVHGTRRKQHLNAVRRRGKEQRRQARRGEQHVPAPPEVGALVGEVLREDEGQVQRSETDVAPAAKKDLGPRLDLTRITSPKRGSKEGEDSAPPFAQMSLFE